MGSGLFAARHPPSTQALSPPRKTGMTLGWSAVNGTGGASLFNTCTKNLENRQSDTEGTYKQTPSKVFRLSYQTTPTIVIPVFSRPGNHINKYYRNNAKKTGIQMENSQKNVSPSPTASEDGFRSFRGPVPPSLQALSSPRKTGMTLRRSATKRLGNHHSLTPVQKTPREQAK